MEQNTPENPKSTTPPEINIFDEFVQSQNVGNEVKKMQEEEEKDFFFYASKLNTFFLSVNILFFGVLLIGFFYTYIQNTPEKKAYSFLSPICSIFLGNASFGQGTCYGITPIHAEYQSQLQSEKHTQTHRITPLLGEIYGIANFHKSQKVAFLQDAQYARLKPTEILSAFDALKNQFSPNDKADIQCSNISITQEKLISLSCSVYSSDWDSKIVGLDGDSLSFLPNGGTAITRASSFINFLENKSDSPFTVKEKTTTFILEDVNIPPYTKKTDITLMLEYRDSQNLLF